MMRKPGSDSGTAGTRSSICPRRACSIRFRGHPDTEVLLEACAAWGVPAAAKRPIGIFAFALRDRAERCLSRVRELGQRLSAPPRSNTSQLRSGDPAVEPGTPAPVPTSPIHPTCAIVSTWPLVDTFIESTPNRTASRDHTNPGRRPMPEAYDGGPKSSARSPRCPFRRRSWRSSRTRRGPSTLWRGDGASAAVRSRSPTVARSQAGSAASTSIPLKTATQSLCALATTENGMAGHCLFRASRPKFVSMVVASPPIR